MSAAAAAASDTDIKDTTANKHTGGPPRSGTNRKKNRDKYSFTKSFYDAMMAMLPAKLFDGKSVVISPGLVGGPISAIATACGEPGRVLVVEPNAENARKLQTEYGGERINRATVTVVHTTLQQFCKDSKAQQGYDMLYWEPKWPTAEKGDTKDVVLKVDEGKAELDGMLLANAVKGLTAIPTIIAVGPLRLDLQATFAGMWKDFPLYGVPVPYVYHPQNAATVLLLSRANLLI